MNEHEPFDLNVFQASLPPLPRKVAAAPPQRKQDNPKEGGGDFSDRDRAIHLARLYLDKRPGAVAHGGGHNSTFDVAITLIHGFALDRTDAQLLMSDWSATACQPPWTADEIAHKLDDAEAKVSPDDGKPKGWRIPPRGHANGVVVNHPRPDPEPDQPPPLPPPDEERPEFKNYTVDGYYIDENGAEKERKVGKVVDDIDFDRVAFFGEWPKRVNNEIFVESKDGKPLFFGEPNSMMSWFDSKSWVRWAHGADYITQSRYYEYLKVNVENYQSVETLPHWPPVPGFYYMYRPVAETGNDCLNKFLNFFKGYESVDRELIKAFIATLFWGGTAGSRPAFLITAGNEEVDQGRGVGKSTLISVICDELMNGFIDVEPIKEIDPIKTRLLSDGARYHRLVRIDNLKTHKFSWAGLEGLITSPIISGKKLYVGEGRRPNMFTWAITINGANLSKDMSQRIIPVKLAKPTYQINWEHNVRMFARNHRDEILADVRDLLLAEPPPGFDAISRWPSWESGVLSKVNLVDECRRTIIERQTTVDIDAENGEDIASFFAEKIRDTGSGDPDTGVFHIRSQTVCEWYNQATCQHEATHHVSAILAGLGLPQLKKYNTKKCRGWIWIGRNCNPDEKMLSIEEAVRKIEKGRML